MIRILLMLATLCAAAAPAEAQRRARRRAVAAPPILWLQPPAPPPIPILIVAAPAPPPRADNAARATVALPDAVRALFAAASRAGDPEAFAAVARLARATNPDNARQIDALVAQNDARLAEAKAREARARADRLASAAFLDLWKGEVEGGVSRATGNSNYLGLYGAAKLMREGLRWRHGLTGRVDYQRTDGATTTERAIAAWQPNYKVDERLFLYGLAQYEHDRFLGYDTRLTGGGGVGYTLVSRPDLRVDLSGGPALRHTRFYERERATTLAGRGSLSVRWTPAPGIALNQDAAVFVESHNSNATATTSFDTRLIGALRARISYNVTYEGDPRADRMSLDTLSRATLIYSF